MPKLVFHDSDGVDKTLSLGTDAVVIGRASECEIQTHDAMVSRKHARISWDGSYWIEDLGSSNGVFLGAEKVQRAQFRPGDVVTCGSLVIRMIADGRRTNAPTEVPDAARSGPPRGLESAPEMPRPRRASKVPAAASAAATENSESREHGAEWDEDLATSASPALAGGGGDAGRAKAELRREIERRERAEAALLEAGGGEAGARELAELRRTVEQLQAEHRPAPAPAIDFEEIREAVAVFNDALAGVKASLRAGVDEAELLSAPLQSVRIVRESMRSAMDELERARERLREMLRKLGMR